MHVAMTTRKPEPPPVNLLEQAADDAARTVLLAALNASGWNLSRTAEALGLSQPLEVRRAIKRLGLTEAYEAAKADGRVRPGKPTGR